MSNTDGTRAVVEIQKPMHRLVFLAALLMPLNALANPVPVPACPATFPTADLHLPPLASGWKPGTRQAPLTSVDFYAGPPEQLGQLMADEDNDKFERWSLGDLPGEDVFWINCLYGDGSLSLSHPLPKGLTACTVHYVPGKAAGKPGSVKTVTCEGPASAH